MGLSYKSEIRTRGGTVSLHSKLTLSRWPVTVFCMVLVSVIQRASAEDLCGGIRNRFVCDRLNPALFHICLGSSKYTMVCPGSLHFNVKTQKCDWPGTVTCVPPSSLQSASPYVPQLSPDREQNTSTSTKTGYTSAVTRQLVTNYRSESKSRNSKVKSKSTPASNSVEPYIASYHRKLSKPEILALKKKVPELLNDKYGSLHAGNVTRKVSIKPAATTKVKDPHFGSTTIAHSAQNHRRSNTISKTNTAHRKEKLNFEGNSVISHPTADRHIPHTSQNKKRQLSTTYLHRSTHPPNRRFRPRVSPHNQMPQKYSARLSPFRKTPWNSLSRSSQHYDNKKDTSFQSTNNNGNSRIINSNTAVQMITTKQPLQPTQRPDTTRRNKGISLAKTPWWNTPRSDARSANSHKSKQSSISYFHKWHKTVDQEDIKDSPAMSNLHKKLESKLAKRQQKRKYKPRNHVPKPSYNTRTPVGNGENAPDGKASSIGNSASQNVHKSARLTSSADNKPPWNTINAAAASSDIKAAVYQSNDLIEASKSEPSADIEIVSTVTEDTPKTKEVSAQESPMEKYSVKRGKCSSTWCKLPACRCVGSDIPGGLEVKEIPQMVMLTFDDSINIQNINFYKELFNGSLKNPNGCPIKSTYFVSGDNSDYQMVKKLSKQGHEIASHTLSHRSPTTWWADAGSENWEHEIVGMKNQLHEKAGVPLKDVVGMRAPFLQVGGDGQYTMLKENKFRYDSSMVTGYLYSNNQPPVWPFTLDTPPDGTTCNISPCPTRSYPGLWEVPLVRWYGSNHIACAMPDACTVDSGHKNVRKFIDQNFDRHYKTNRAPFGIFIHAAWFSRTEGVFEALKGFLTSLTNKEDVWVVTVSQALDWIQHPVRLPALNAIDSWAC